MTDAATGAYTYEPAAGYVGADSFTFTVTDAGGLSDTGTVTVDVVNTGATATVDVANTNDAPVAVDDGYSVDQGTTLTVAAAAGVLANDNDNDGDPLTAVLVDDVTKGSLALADDGSFVYTPNGNSHGVVFFTYQAYDGTDTSATVTVTITVNKI